jgi:hypothetical protein
LHPPPPQAGHVGPWIRACSAARSKAKKARIRAFFLSRSALSLFFALLRFVSFALASATAKKSANDQLW